MDRISVFDKELFLYVPVLHTREGRICPYVVADGKFTKLVTAYFSIQSDLMETQAMILYLKDNPVIPGVVKASMFKAIIIQYAKCFTKAWGRAAKLEAKSVFHSQEDHLEIHDEVMEMRNNYIAHAGKGKYDYGAMVMYLNPDTDKPGIGRIIHADLKFLDHSLKLSGYDKICQTALEYVDSKMEKLSTAYTIEVDSMDLEELYQKSKTPQRKDWEFRIDDTDMRQTRGPHNLNH